MQWPSKLSSHSPQNFSLRKISYIFPKKKNISENRAFQPQA